MWVDMADRFLGRTLSLQGAWGPFGAELIPHVFLERSQGLCLLTLPALRLPSQARLPSGLRHSFAPEVRPWLVHACG